MSKVIAMIPARLGSKRVKNKNLRLIDGKPLISYVVETAVESGIFDEIYINSEADIFDDIAKQYNIKFYKRPAYLAEDDKTNDDFAYEFLQNVECDTLVQLLSTSPFMSVDDVKSFVDTYKENHDKQLEKMKASEDKDVKFFANYPFDKENVKRFATFCKESGGFEIC